MSSDSGQPRLQISIPQPWFAVLSRGQRLLAGVVIGALIYMGGGVLDWFVTRQYLPRISLMLSGAAVSLAVALLVFKILTDVQRRYQAMVHRLQRIEELNHHIRNALQVIAYHNVTERSERAALPRWRKRSEVRILDAATGFPSGAEARCRFRMPSFALKGVRSSTAVHA